VYWDISIEGRIEIADNPTVSTAVYVISVSHFCLCAIIFRFHTENTNIAIQMISEICAWPDSIDNDNGIATILADLYERVSRNRCMKNHAHGRYEALAIMFRLPTCVTNIDEN
jgi:hypothetical protein